MLQEIARFIGMSVAVGSVCLAAIAWAPSAHAEDRGVAAEVRKGISYYQTQGDIHDMMAYSTGMVDATALYCTASLRLTKEERNALGEERRLAVQSSAFSAIYMEAHQVVSMAVIHGGQRQCDLMVKYFPRIFEAK